MIFSPFSFLDNVDYKSSFEIEVYEGRHSVSSLSFSSRVMDIEKNTIQKTDQGINTAIESIKGYDVA
jgi:hypothetical protein